MPEPTASLRAVHAPSGRDAGLMSIAVLGVSFSGPLMAATTAPALAIAFWRNLGGAAFSTAAVAATAGGRRALRAARGRPLLLAVAAGLLLALHFGTWVPSLTMTSVASATALVSTQAIFSALIAFCRGAAVPRIAWLGMAVSLLGVLLVTGVDSSLSLRAAAGDLLALLGGLAAALYMTVGSQARQHMTTPAYTAICYACAAGALLAACLLGGQTLGGYPASDWAKILAVTLCAQILGHTVLNVVVATTSPTVVAMALLLEVPGAALIAYIWLGQSPPASAIPGLVLIVAGLLAVTRGDAGQSESSRSEPPPT